MLQHDAKNRLWCRLDVDGEGRAYFVGLHVCKDPLCLCQEVTVSLLDPEGVEAGATDPVAVFEIDMQEWRLQTDPAPDESVPGLAQAFADQLSGEDKLLLAEFYLLSKRKVSREARPDEIEASFDVEAIRAGMLIGYKEILPYDGFFFLPIEGRLYSVEDMYCLTAGCSCSKVLLHLFDQEQEPVARCFVDYKRNTWESAESEEPVIEARIPLKTFRKHLIETYPGFVRGLRERHRRLRRIYAAFCKRQATSSTPSSPARVGRNDPCPCGSGKKYKKCCLSGAGR